MSTLEEAKDNYAHSIGYKNWEECINDQPNYKVEKILDKFYHFRISQQVKEALERAAEKNYEQYRELNDSALEEKHDELNARKLRNLARGYKYAAKICQSLIKEY